MAKKKPPEEHENLERWLVSYSDFMTLLFATFVVLYALAQTDVNSFKSMEEALKKAFSQTFFEAQTSIMDGQDSILNGENGAINPLMLEYMSQKYEQTSYEDIQEEIENLKQDGLSAQLEEKGLVIRLNDHALKFAPGTAELTPESIETLEIVAKIIKEKFSIHYIQIEGHTDSDTISTDKFPSNWELSAARASSVVRAFIKLHDFNPKIFIAAGLADTVPIAPNTTAENKSKNRRVEIVVLKNKHRNLSDKDLKSIIKEVEQARKNPKPKHHSRAIEGLVGNDRELLKNVIDISDQYENESKRLESLDSQDYTNGESKPDFME